MINRNNTTVYILKCNNGSYYTGITNNINRRITEHKKGVNGSFFKRKELHPFVIIHKETFNDRTSARKRERYLKQMRTKNLMEVLLR